MIAASLPHSTIERIVRPHLKHLASREAIHPDASLAEAGLDAVSSIDLIVQLEEELAVSIPDSAIEAESLRTLRGIRALVARLQPGA
jgi:acyl carrier protein